MITFLRKTTNYTIVWIFVREPIFSFSVAEPDDFITVFKNDDLDPTLNHFTIFTTYFCKSVSISSSFFQGVSANGLTCNWRMSIITQDCSSLQVVGCKDQSVCQTLCCHSSQCQDAVFLNVTPRKVQSQWHCAKNWSQLLYLDLSAGGSNGVPWRSAAHKQPYRVHRSAFPPTNWTQARLSYTHYSHYTMALSNIGKHRLSQT